MPNTDQNSRTDPKHPSIKINGDQIFSIFFYQHWDRHWSVLIGIGHWSGDSCKKVGGIYIWDVPTVKQVCRKSLRSMGWKRVLSCFYFCTSDPFGKLSSQSKGQVKVIKTEQQWENMWRVIYLFVRGRHLKYSVAKWKYRRESFYHLRAVNQHQFFFWLSFYLREGQRQNWFLLYGPSNMEKQAPDSDLIPPPPVPPVLYHFPKISFPVPPHHQTEFQPIWFGSK